MDDNDQATTDISAGFDYIAEHAELIVLLIVLRAAESAPLFYVSPD